MIIMILCLKMSISPQIIPTKYKKRVVTNLTTLPIGDTPILSMEHVHCSECKGSLFFFFIFHTF